MRKRKEDNKATANQPAGVGAGQMPPLFVRPKSLQEVLARYNSPARRIGRFLRARWVFVIIAIIIFLCTQSREFLNIVLTILGFAVQLLFAIGFAIIQFVAIFWFMSQTKIEVIRPGDPKVLTLADYKGQPNLVKLVQQWISLLSDRGQFQKMGGRFINGLLLYGAPGTGKTMLAKCMAGEANIAFISIEGSGFRAMFWGVDVLRMISFISKARKLAREYGACIAFIDEIDAVGASRGGVMGGQQQVGMGMGGFMGGGSGALTRLLYEMDGVEEIGRLEKLKGRIYKLFGKKLPPRDWHLLFMGSTNRPDVLDPALKRPGRFDRMIQVDPPDRTGRREIIQYYLDKVQYDESVDIEAIVGDTTGYTPAQIMSAITKDAVRMAVFDGRLKINQRDIDLAFQEQAMGLENPIEEMEEDQRRQIAYHEAGHAVAFHYLMPEMRIVRTTIIRRSGALGYVMPALNYEVYSYPLKYLVRDVMVSLAGQVATKIFLGELHSGTGSDYQQARARIWQLANSGYFGPPIADPEASHSGQFKSKEMARFWEEAEATTERLLREHADEVEAIAQALIEKHDLSGKETVELILKAGGHLNGHRVKREIHKPTPEAILTEAETRAKAGLPSPNGDSETHHTDEPVEEESEETKAESPSHENEPVAED
jgi:cell division protease FtsH